MKKLILSLFIMALGISFAGAAYGAGSVTAILDVSVNLVPACTVTVTPIDFGDYDGIASVPGAPNGLANGDVTVNCSDTVSYNIALDAGLHYNAPNREVSDGVNGIGYGLYQDSAYTTEWGDSDFGNTYAAGLSQGDTGNGLDQPHTVYGGLGASSGPLGPYTDVVTVTVHY
jgi:spore coat protein U-like protein